MTVQLYHGDCLAILPTLDAGSVDAVITDPPYLTGNTQVPIRGAGVARLRRATESVGVPWGYSLDWIDVCESLLRPQHWIVFANYSMLGGLLVRLEQFAQISNVFVWRKSNAPRMTRPVPRLDCEFIVWARRKGATCGKMGDFDSSCLDVPMPQAGCMAHERVVERGSGKAVHPCQKPLAVVNPFLLRLPIESAVDPFMGTGTTGVAAVKTGRNFIGIEQDETYFCIARQRIGDAEAQGRFELD